MTHEFSYPVTLTPDRHSGGFVVTCADLPEVVTQGQDRAEALQQAADAIEEAIAGRIRRGDVIPRPSRPRPRQPVVPVPPVTAAKAALLLAMREAHISQVHLAKLLDCDEKEVRRLLDPRHPSKMPRIQRALEVLGKRLSLSVMDRVA
jgi:antitoxin HicB